MPEDNIMNASVLKSRDEDNDFLIREGLDLMAAYRLIKDPDLRAILRSLMFRLAEIER